MFVATREIRTATGRFALMSGVVAMLTFLLVVLTALTQGLGNQSTSAIEALPADRIILTPTDGDKATYADSVISEDQAKVWAGVDGVSVTPLGIGHARLEKGASATTVALMGVADGFASQAGTPEVADNEVVLPAEAATALGAEVGDVVTVNGAELVVGAVEPTLWYSHSPVARTTARTFDEVTHSPKGRVGSVLLAHVDESVSDEALAEADASAGTVTLTRGDSLQALPGYTSEHSSLLLIQAFLYGISALVVIAFVSVWTIQRTRDLAVLRALGASRGYVLRDALGQAALLLVLGTLVGVVLGLAAVALLDERAPVLLSASALLVPALGITALGLAGSALATRRVSRVDPLLALGGN